MKNKRNIIAFILLLLPLVVAVGMSTWIILNESFLNPSYKPDPVIKKYYDATETVTYNGLPQSPTSSATDLVGFGELEFLYRESTSNNDSDYSNVPPVNAGTYDIKISVKELENSTKTVKLIINPKPISIEVYGEPEFTFNKSKQVPSLKVVEGLIGDDKCMLYVDDDYDSVDAGNYVLTKNNIKLSNSNYTLDGNPSFNYVIKQKNISDSNVIFEDLTNCNYDGSKHEPVVKAKVNFNSKYYVLTANVDYTVDYADNVNEGTATVIVTGKGNYIGTKILTFEIEPGLIDLSKTTISGISDLTYSGIAQTPTFKVSIGGTELINGNDFTFSCNNNINAGTATLTLNPISGRSENTKMVNFNILPLKINVKNKIVSMDYVSGGYTWNDSFISKLLQNIEFTKFDNSVLPLTISSYNIDNMDDGTFGYGNYSVEAGLNDVNKTGINPNDYTQIVGSTYAVSVKIDDGNFELINNTFILKYKTVKLGVNGTVWYTIEDALNLTNNTETLFLAGQDVTNGFITTAFSNLSVEQGYPYNINSSDVYTYTLGSSRKLIVPYEEQINNETKPDVENGFVKNTYNVYSCLYLNERITLKIENTSKLIVDAKLGFNQSNYPNVTTTCSKNRGVVMNNGIINNYGEIYAYGFIKSSKYEHGKINLEKNAVIIDSFHTYDWPGGNTASKLKYTLPMNAWNVHNISCETIIKYGSTYKACFYSYIRMDIFTSFEIVSSGSNSIFKPENENSYIIKKAQSADNEQNDYLTLITQSNQEKGQKDVIYVFGEWVDSTISIAVDNFTISTDLTKACPISYMNIIISKNAKLTLKSASYVFLPGTQILVQENGELYISSGVSLSFENCNNMNNSQVTAGTNYFSKCCIDSFDSKLIVEGKINCLGKIGGLIISNSTNAFLNFTNATTETSFSSLFRAVGASSQSASNCAYKIDNYKSIGYFDETNNVYGFNSSEYSSIFINGKYIWIGDNSGKVTTIEENKVASNGNFSTTDSVAGCLIEGTLITLADGTKKKVEDITSNDILLVFNHETGRYDFARVIFNDSEMYQLFTIINLKFSNGKIIKVISEHGFFDLDLMKYVYITENDYKDYVGHRFYSAEWDGTTYKENEVILEDAYITTEMTRCYSPVTEYHLNYFVEDLLSMPGGIEGLFNIFDYDSTLKYDEEKMNSDIEKYGLFSYEDFKDLVPYEIYCLFPTKYFKVAIAKNLLTMEQIQYYIDRYLPLMEERN